MPHALGVWWNQANGSWAVFSQDHTAMRIGARFTIQTDLLPRVAFTSNRDGNYEIYTISTLGGCVRRVTNFSGSDMEPALSPNRRSLAFVRRQPTSDSTQQPDVHSGIPMAAVPISPRNAMATVRSTVCSRTEPV